MIAERVGQLLFYLIAGLFNIVLLVALRQFLIDRRYLSQSINWPCTRGIVTAVHKDSETQKYTIGVEYEYDVNGRTYHNGNVNFTLRDIKVDYKQGMAVDVFYRPDDPQTSVLEPGGSYAYVRCLPVVLFLGFFIFLLFYYLFLN